MNYRDGKNNQKTLAAIKPELEEHARIEVASGITEALERQQDKLGNIDEALARIEAGTFGECQDWTAHRQGAA